MVRARTLEIFSEPCLSIPGSADRTQPQEIARGVFHPLARHSFGSLDGVAVMPQFECGIGHYDQHEEGIHPLRILIRKESDDPWTADIHHVEMYTLQPATFPPEEDSCSLVPTDWPPPSLANGPCCPYRFPPNPTPYSEPTPRGLLRNRCTDIHLGPCGTALWIQPSVQYSDLEQNMGSGLGLTAWDVHASRAQGPNHFGHLGIEKGGEQLVGRLFRMPSGLVSTLHTREHDDKCGSRVLWVSEREGPLSAVDYDEGAGRIVVGEGGGWLSVLDLVA